MLKVHKVRLAARPSQGFTLVETIVSIAIVILLVSLVAPALGEATKRAARTDDISKLRQIGMAATLYESDNDSHPLSLVNMLLAQKLDGRLFESSRDPYPEGLANGVVQFMGPPSPSYGMIPPTSRISFLSLGDYYAPGSLVDEIRSDSGAGWVVNLVEDTKLGPSMGSPCQWQGKYDRLRFDGSVSRQVLFQLEIKLDGRISKACSPVMFFVNWNDRWKQKIFGD